VVLLGKDLLCPADDTTADKKKTRETDSDIRHKACERERDTEGEKNRPRRACRHLNNLCLALFSYAVIHHKSPSDQVNDCKHHDPHCIHEVPIQGDYAETFTLSRINPTEQG